jgi:hypothetical protein
LVTPGSIADGNGPGHAVRRVARILREAVGREPAHPVGKPAIFDRVDREFLKKVFDAERSNVAIHSGANLSLHALIGADW